MGYINGIFERATIQGIADYLLFGIGPEKDERSYEERLDEPYKRFERAVAKYDKNPSSELLDLSNEVTSETAAVYMEIGLQVGFLLAQDMIKNLRREKQTECATVWGFSHRKEQPMNNETSKASTPAAASPLTAKPDLVKNIGGTTFDIHIHFSETSRETFTDKVVRLIKNDSGDETA